MSSTRLLLLGVVRIFQPAYGYQLRRELVSWNVETWANINPGSIYSGLRTLARHGLLAETESADEGRSAGRTVYRLTAEGEEEYFRLLREELWNVRNVDSTGLMTAMSFVWTLRRDEAIAALESRIAQHEAAAASQAFTERGILDSPGTPNNVVEQIRLGYARDAGELVWTRDLVTRLREGAYSFAGEKPDWEAPDDLLTHWRTEPPPP